MKSFNSFSDNSFLTQLHVIHNWGGGAERWVKDYCRTDVRRNLVLKPSGSPTKTFQRFDLYAHVDDEKPIRSWELSTSIYGTSISNNDYLYLLEEIVQDFSVQVIFISSLIGHSLDLLQTGLRTIVVCHDYYPFCAASIIYFDKICTECGFSHLQKCFRDNPFNYFPEISASFWMRLREIFTAAVLQPQVSLVAPSASVQRNLSRLAPQLEKASFTVIPHGIDLHISPINSNQLLNLLDRKIDSNNIHFPVTESKLKILILGRLDAHKGLNLLREVAPQISEIADVLLLGCGEEAAQVFSNHQNVKTICERYNASELPSKVLEIAPDLCLFLSICPETFSYTLSEAMLLGIPALAPNIGSFVDRITDQINGFLVNPDERAIVQKIWELSQHRSLLTTVKHQLQHQSHATLQQMVEAYHQLISTNQSTSSTQPRDSSQHYLQEISELYEQLRARDRSISNLEHRLFQTESTLVQTQQALHQTQATQAHMQQALDQTQQTLTQTQQALERTQRALEQSTALMEWMQGSKFWKLRQVWLRLKQRLRLK